MEVSLSIFGEVEVDDYIDSLDVNTPGEEIYLGGGDNRTLD